MIQEIEFSPENEDCEICFQIGEVNDFCNFHVEVSRSEGNSKGTIRLTPEDLREIENVIGQYQASRSQSAVYEEFSKKMTMDKKKLQEGPKWIKNGKFSLKIGKLEGKNVINFEAGTYTGSGEFKVVAPLGEDDETLRKLRQMINDFLREPLKIELPSNTPEILSDAENHLEFSIKKFHMSEFKGAAAEAREAFNAIEKHQNSFEGNIGEKKLSDIMASVDSVKDFALHCEDREESLDPSDVSLIISNMSSLLNYLSKRIN